VWRGNPDNRRLLFAAVGWTNKTRQIVSAHFGILFFIAIGQLFGLAQPLLLSFPTERPIFLREHATGTYNGLAYFLSNLFVEIPVGMVQIAVVWFCTYWIAGLQGNWFFLWLATCLLGFVSASTAVLIGAIVPTVETAIQVRSFRRVRRGHVGRQPVVVLVVLVVL
jgi:ABC-type multidrug transport system permease subunit